MPAEVSVSNVVPFDTTTPEEIERNFRLGAINGVIYIFAETFLDPTLVLVAFISHLTSSPFLLGLVVPIRDASWALPQLWVSHYIQRLPTKMSVYKTMAYVRIATWIIIAVIINFIRDPFWILIAFFVSFSISSLASGMSGLPFLEIVSKTIPPNRRGEMYAWRLGVGGLLGIGGSAIVRWMISPESPLPFPSNYGMLSVLFLVFATIALLTYLGVHEMPDQYFPPQRRMRDEVRTAFLEIRKNTNYRRLILAQSLLLISGSATPFFAVYVNDKLGGSSEWIGIYLGVMMAANLVSNIIFGRLSRKVNNQRVLLFASLAGTLMSVLVLVLAILARPLGISPLIASIWLIPVFLLNGIRGTGIGVSSNSLIMNIAPPQERSLIIGFSQTLLGVVLLLTGINGVVLGWFGFAFLVCLTLGTHLMSVYLITRIYDIS